MTDTIDKVAFAAAELLAASDALASAAADVDALRAEVTRQTGIAVDHCARADAAEKARDEVGIQLAAAQERIKLLEEGAALLRDLYEDRGEPKWAGNGSNHYHVPCDVIDIGVGCFLSALDAVPGDALAREAHVEPIIVGVHPCGKESPSGAVGVAQTAGGERFFIDGNGLRITAALEASGIDTSNVKGVE